MADNHNHNEALTDILEDDFSVDKIIPLIEGSNKDKVSTKSFLKALRMEGILEDDQRLNKFFEASSNGQINGEIKKDDLEEILKNSAIIKNALTKNLVIPDFDDLYRDVLEIFQETISNTGGKLADYIPQLARVNPEQFAVSICTIDGQRFSLGDSLQPFCLQSTCKPVNYCLSMKEHGENYVHHHVGREPSGRSFNELSLNKDGLPHNPMINAGSIMSCSMIKPDLNMADRFDYVFDIWKRLCAGKGVSFNNAVYLSERQTADRNFALAYFMRENKAFPAKTNLIETLEFYFQCCSIESCTHNLAIAAATLANSGVNPITGDKIFDDTTVRHCMSLMLSCGMYDFSGEFAFKIGVPAKSGVSGALQVVIPNLMGISIWSPRLDQHGNSVRGVEFCERLIEKYSFHNFDSLTRQTSKKNPRKRKYQTKVDQVVNLIYAASFGDLDEIKRLEATGVDLSAPDYDGRTALHLAAAENQAEVVRYLISRKINLEPIDRWGGKPIDDARKEEHTKVIELLEKAVVKSE